MGETLERGDQEGVVVFLAEELAAVTEQWNRRSRIWGSKRGSFT